VNPFRGREATAPSVIRKIREVQRLEDSGGAITPDDVHMKPFRSKSELNPSLHSRVIDRPRGPDGLPGGHADFDGGHPGLREDFTFFRVSPKVKTGNSCILHLEGCQIKIKKC